MGFPVVLEHESRFGVVKIHSSDPIPFIAKIYLDFRAWQSPPD
jgi:hypothetical protein